MDTNREEFQIKAVFFKVTSRHAQSALKLWFKEFSYRDAFLLIIIIVIIVIIIIFLYFVLHVN